MSPLEIKILLHYYYSPEGVDYPEPVSQAYSDAIAKFCAHGICYLSEDQKVYANPSAIEAYAKAVMAIPLPTQKWVIE